MSAFTQADDEGLDWRLLRESSVSVYSDEDLLERHLGELAGSSYTIVEFGCAGRSSAELTVELSSALGRPITGRGGYLSALDDVLCDPGRLSSNVPTPGGLVFLLRDFDEFTMVNERDASGILSILAGHSRVALMLGLRWIIVAHVSDPDFSFKPLQLEVKLNLDEASMRANAVVDWPAVLGHSPDDSES